MEDDIVLLLIILAIHFGVSFLIIWLVYRLFKNLLGLLKEPVKGTKNTSLNLFLSFGIALIFFRETALSSIAHLWKFVISPLDSIELIKSNFNRTSLHDVALENYIADFIFEWSENLKEIFYTTILNINYPGIIILLTFWLLISLLFREIEQSAKYVNGAGSVEGINNLTSNPTVKNIFTILLLVFSTYLSVSSIVAVPEFQNLNVALNENDINQKFAEELESQRVYSKDNLLSTKDTVLNNNLQINELERTLRWLRSATDNYNTSVNTNWVRDEKAKKIAINRMKAAVDEKMGVKERIRYKLLLTDWYLSYHEAWTSNTSFCQSKLASAIESISDISSDEYNMSLDTVFKPDRTINYFKLNDFASLRLERISEDLRDLISQLYLINVNYNTNRIPDKPQIGEKFGIFNSISGWLLKTESLSLALIVGLFGFGLMGSIGSTFIRRRIKKISTEKDNDTIVVYDLQGILVNGISAAIIVFLAVKGAVVVFSTDGDNLNPYILFFTCLVASVFSEDVWNWARIKLNHSLGNKEKKAIREMNEDADNSSGEK